jgi:hypothetical protein
VITYFYPPITLVLKPFMHAAALALAPANTIITAVRWSRFTKVTVASEPPLCDWTNNPYAKICLFYAHRHLVGPIVVRWMSL